MSTPAPILIGSFVTPTGDISARLQDGDFVTIKEGERFEIESLGCGLVILMRPDDKTAPRVICPVADLKPWLE